MLSLGGSKPLASKGIGWVHTHEESESVKGIDQSNEPMLEPRCGDEAYSLLEEQANLISGFPPLPSQSGSRRT